MTQQQEREARAREVLATAIRAQGDSAQSADGIEQGRDHAVWAHVALRAMLAFSDAERTAAAVPASAQGWRLVPVEPTEAMTDAAVDAGVRYADQCEADGQPCYGTPYGVSWSAMLAAAPQPEPEHVTGAGEKA